MPDSKRQLAAIMFTDIVGYTALMGRDSEKALEIVRISKEIQKPLVEKHDGRWLKEMGDGSLAQFSTALDAVKCAIDIQKSARAELDAKLRIGIHLGDVTVEEHDVYGDGVNVASRLESIADPGGIYISESIERAIKGQLDIRAIYLGESKLKNVDYEVRTYAIQGTGLPVPESKGKKHLHGRFWAELNRRGVIRAGITYLLVSILILLLYSYFAPAFNLPAWAFNSLIALLVILFPAAMYLAWNYEFSPEGIVHTNSKHSWRNPYKASQRKPFTNYILIAGLFMIIIIMYVFPRGREFNPSLTDHELPEPVDTRTIAVLPFEDMSQNRDQEWFSDGMMEEILNHMVKIKDLMVISRTSAMRYKGSEKSLQEIGQELGVSHILEGSVRKQGNRVRITVQLIDVQTDLHVWSETYDRNLDDVFAIQSEVAQHVASSLQASVHPEVKMRIEAQPTDNQEAYDLYLEGLYAYYKFTKESHIKAENIFEEVIGLDPEFADAYAYLGLLRSAFTWANSNSNLSGPEEAVRIAQPYYEKALEIDPDNITVHEFLGNMYLWYQWDFEKAEREYNITKELNPGFVWPDFLITSGQFDEAVRETERQVKRDPFNEAVWGGRLLSLYFGGYREKTMETIDMLLRTNTDHNLVERGRAYLYLGMYEESAALMDSLIANLGYENIPRVTGTLAIACHHTGKDVKRDQLLTRIKNQSEKSSGGSPSFYVAMIYAQMGEPDLAFEWLNKAYEDHEVEMYWLKVEPPFEPLYDDPRWQKMLDIVGFPEF